MKKIKFYGSLYGCPVEPGKYYLWKNIVREIDPRMGRNTTLCFLKFKGILDQVNNPIADNPEFMYFKSLPLKNPYTPHGHYYDHKVFLIQGEGINEIRRILKNERINGCNI